MFFAPALLWIGATLLLVRLRGRALALARRRARRGGRASTPRGFLLASAGAPRRGDQPRAGRRRAAARLRRQPRDLHRHLRPAGQRRRAAHARRRRHRHRAARRRRRSATSPRRIAARPGRRSARPRVDHSYAYVGPDLQDTYGIDPATIAQRDDAARLLLPRRQRRSRRSRGCARTPDGILVSKETITDYSLKLGDLLQPARARPPHRPLPRRALPRRRHRAGVPLGAARTRSWSPTSRYLQAADHAGGPNVVFAKASGDPAAVARRGRAPRPRADGTIVKNIRQQAAADRQLDHDRRPARASATSRRRSRSCSPPRRWRCSSRSAMIERRHEFATMAALGASLRDIGAFVWSEAALVLVAGAAARRRPRLAAGADARRDAPARLRPAARPARDPVGLPRRARRRRGGGDRARGRDRRPPAAAPAARAAAQRAVSVRVVRPLGGGP